MSFTMFHAGDRVFNFAMTDGLIATVIRPGNSGFWIVKLDSDGSERQWDENDMAFAHPNL